MNHHSAFRKSLQQAINANSKENGSNTPDWILARYLANCLDAYDKAVRQRERWYGRGPKRAKPPVNVPYPLSKRAARDS